MADSALSSMMAAAKSFVVGATKPEAMAPGPGDVGPTVNTPDPTQLVTLEMTEEEVGLWWERIEAARQRVKNREGEWDTLLKAYLPLITKQGQAEEVRTNAHFRNVHSKIGQIFYRDPDLILTPRDPSPAQNQIPNPMQAMAPVDPLTGMQVQLPPLTMEDVIIVKQSILQQKLGRDEMKANRLMDELIFDVLAWAGFGACKVGYRAVMKTIQKPKMMPAPMPEMTQPPPSMLGLQEAAPPNPALPAPMVPMMDPMTGQPVMEPVQVPIFEEWYGRRFSPKKALWNADLHSTRFDEDATWMGMEFYLSPRQAKNMLGMTDEEIAAATAEDDRIFQYDKDPKQDSKQAGLVHCVEVYCRACQFTDELHPLALNQLILVEKISTKPFVWRPSPDQTFDENGKLTHDSVTQFPYRILTIRDLADSPFTSSDSAFTNNLVKQINTHRRQSVKMRDAAIGKYFYDIGALEDGDIDAVINAEVGDYIALSSGALKDGPDRVVALVAQAHASPDDWRTAEILKQDMNETLGISANQAGASEQSVHTATEIATMSSAMQARNEKEQGRAVDFYLDIARITDTLLMRYATEDQYVAITGEEGASTLQMWNNKLIAGKFYYDIAPDSQSRVDTRQDFQDALNFYNMGAPDPLFNRKYVLRRIARMKGWDPNKVVLNPDQQMMQPAHGGTSGAGDVVNKHQSTNSGKRENEPGAENKRDVTNG